MKKIFNTICYVSLMFFMLVSSALAERSETDLSEPTEGNSTFATEPVNTSEKQEQPQSSTYTNSLYGFTVQVPDDWKKVYEQIFNDKPGRWTLCYGLPEVWGEIENQNISNAILIIVFRNKFVDSIEYGIFGHLGSVDDVVRYEFLRAKETIRSKEEVPSLRGKAFLINSEYGGHKYKIKETFLFENGMGYVISFVATKGTFDKNLKKYESFLENLTFIEADKITEKATPEQNERFKKNVEGLFKQSPDVVYPASLLIGYNLWSKMKNIPALSKIEKGQVFYSRPNSQIANEKEKDILKYEGKVLWEKENIQTFLKELVQDLPIDNLTVRDLTQNEIEQYWYMINNEISEPICLVEMNGRKFIANEDELNQGNTLIHLEELKEDDSSSLNTGQLSNLSRTLSPYVNDTDLRELAAGNSTFAVELYQKLRGQGGNLFYSPYSISLALAMAYAGARSETALQMENTLHFTLPGERLHRAFNALDIELAGRGERGEGENRKGFILNIANSMWGQIGHPFLLDFLDILAENYGAGLKLLDFRGAPEKSRITINNRVSEQTNHKINDVIPPGAISSQMGLVLVNAIYFNAAWENKFQESLTRDDSFYLLDKNPVTVPMMTQTKYFDYTEGDNYQAAELLYNGYKFSMVVMLPREGQFDEFENALTPAKLNEIVNKLKSVKSTRLKLTLPKFKYESDSISLKETLSEMGMTDAFSGTADFSGIDGGSSLFIGDILHKTFVAVDEEGTEAAGVTVVHLVKGLPPQKPPKPVQFTVNRPFLFLICDNKTGTILFLGRIVNPAG